MRAFVIFSLATLLLLGPAKAQAPEIDGSGKGAVLCAWLIYTGFQAQRQACAWEPVPADAAIDQAVSDIENFIIENSSTPVTLEQLAEGRQRQMETVDSCEFDPDDHTSWTAMVWAARQQSEADIGRAVADLLSVPREPVINPCL